MQLTTTVKAPVTPTITHASRIMMFGSCFAHCMAERLARLRFTILQNPFGITYNPVSIAAQIARLREERPYVADELRSADGLCFSADHHGRFSAATAAQTLAAINAEYTEAAAMLPMVTHFILTLGSAVVYEKEGRVWNNCHKLPGSLFTKRRLSVDEVVDALAPIIENFGTSRFIITVSPVRYMNDGNSANKATLLIATDRLADTYDNVLYFPAYEIMMDELRDYRFYADDMLHPSPLAEQIIFDRFSHSLFTPNTLRLNEEIEQLNSMQNHRPLHPDSPEYLRFKQKLTIYEKNVADALARSRCADDDCPDPK